MPSELDMACWLLRKRQDVARTETTRVAGGKIEVIIRIRPLTVAVPRAEHEHELKAMHLKLLQTLTSEPQTVKTVARLAGYSPRNDNVRKGLYHLFRLGLVERTAAGYFLPGAATGRD